MGEVVVPGEVAAAVVTRRVEFLNSLRAKVKRGDYPSELAILNLIDLVEDSIKRAEADDARLRKLAARFRAAKGQVKGLLTTLDDLEAACKGDPTDDEEF